MNLKYLYDSKGIQTDVVIPIEEWNKIVEENRDLRKSLLNDNLKPSYNKSFIEKTKKSILQIENGESSTMPLDVFNHFLGIGK